MAGNSNALWSKVGDIQWGGINTGANTALDGTGTVITVFTSDVTNGGRVERVRALHAGTNVATVARIFINNGSTNTVAANNWLINDATVAANTISQTAGSTVAFDFSGAPFPLVLPPGYRILETQGTATAAGINAGAIGGKY